MTHFSCVDCGYAVVVVLGVDLDQIVLLSHTRHSISTTTLDDRSAIALHLPLRLPYIPSHFYLPVFHPHWITEQRAH